MRHSYMNIKRDGSGIILIGMEVDGNIGTPGSRRVVQEYNFSGNDLVFAGQSYLPYDDKDYLETGFMGLQGYLFSSTSRGLDKLYYGYFDPDGYHAGVRIMTAAPGCAP